MRALVLSGRVPALESPDAAAPFFLQHFAHPALAGVVFAGLFAAIMSTADSFLNIGAAALVHDIPLACRGRPPRRELGWARAATLLLALAAALLALWSGDLVALLGLAAWGTFAAALVPAAAIGLNWKRAHPAAANASILFGLLGSFGARLLGLRLPHAFDAGALALVLSAVLFLGLSLLLPPRRLPREIEELMEL
jgi:Na+/proline symporter